MTGWAEHAESEGVLTIFLVQESAHYYVAFLGIRTIIRRQHMHCRTHSGLHVS